MKALTEIQLPGLKPNYRGKVRDVYRVDDNRLLIVATDRLSAFDVVFSQGIPEKGSILTSISNHWFSLLNFIPNHLLETNASRFPEPFRSYTDILQGRSVLTRRAERIDFECVVRGYLMGSAYKEYRAYGTVAGETVAPGMKLGEAFALPIFSPATKNDRGHDENISYAQFSQQLGEPLAGQLKELSLQIFAYASRRLAEKDLLLLDSKFEFGFIDGQVSLIDEVLTPDSSRFCFRDDWSRAMSRGENPPTSDKQILRDYLETTGWNKQPPAPQLPEKILQQTALQYKKMQEVILCLLPE